MHMGKYCGPHADAVTGSEVVSGMVDVIDTLRFYASKPGSPAFYARAVSELEMLRAENEKLRIELHEKNNKT